MTATVATHHPTLARQARDAGRLADCLSNATTAWGIAAAEKDHATARDSISCIGRAYLAREEPDEARRWYAEAFDYARESGMVLGMAHAAHDRYLAALECGKTGEAHRAVGTAFDLYGYPGRRVSALLADRSMEVLRTDPCVTYHAQRAAFVEADNARDRVFALANTVTATSYASAALFEDLFPALLSLLDSPCERTSMLYVVAGEDAVRMDRREEGYRLAERGFHIAGQRGEAKVQDRAQNAMDAADSWRKVISGAGRDSGPALLSRQPCPFSPSPLSPPSPSRPVPDPRPCPGGGVGVTSVSGAGFWFGSAFGSGTVR